MLAGQALIVRACTHRPEDFGQDLQIGAVLACERLAEEHLRTAFGISVRRIESRDADIERGMNGGDGLPVIDLCTMGRPVPQGHCADLEPTIAQAAVLHRRTLRPSPWL